MLGPSRPAIAAALLAGLLRLTQWGGLMVAIAVAGALFGMVSLLLMWRKLAVIARNTEGLPAAMTNLTNVATALAERFDQRADG